MQTLQKDEYKGFALYKEFEEEEYIKFKKGRSAWHGIYIWFGVSRDDIYMRIVTKEEEKCNALLKMQKDNILDYKFEEKIDKFEEIKDRLFDVFLYLSNYINNLSKDDFKIIKDYNMMKNNTPLNQILYGPPGTGKTYQTIDKALEIISKEEKIQIPSKDDRKNRKELFDEYVKNGQIVFTTFHQSYGYEEFIEGIKPHIDSKENSKEVEYEIKDGIFKELCKKALDNYENSILNIDELNKKIELKEKVENFLNWLLETNEPIGKTKGGNFFVVDINDKTVMIYSEGVERFDGNFNLSISIFMELLKHKDEFNNAAEMFKKVFDRDYADRTHTYYFNLVKKFKAYEKQSTAKNENKKNNDNSLKPYIIIIDEINRGNVSKIFGELITLIEPSKRIGKEEELKVTLPYSKDEFGVPKNVYIIGTMNTADRSITSLDTALRRRFEFIEMIPKPNVLSDNCEGVNLQELLKAINTRIEYLLDREKTIGHAFFIGIENLEKLKNVFQNKIIPLLQEYFYNDYALIDAVLNKNGMLENVIVENKDYLKNMTEFIESDKVIYKFSDSQKWDEATFKKIYE
nr:AAA family ATPase [Campylobacter sp. IFREMER_LSEM_CL1846]